MSGPTIRDNLGAAWPPFKWIGSAIKAALQGANAPTSENPFATLADVGGGGGSDPLELVHYLSVGANASKVEGQIGLEEGASVLSHSADYSADSGEEEGDQALIGLQTYDAGFGSFSAIRIGAANGPIGAEMILDGYWNTALVLTNRQHIILTDAPDYSDPNGLVTNFQAFDLGPDGVLLTATPPNAGESRNPGDYTLLGRYHPTLGVVSDVTSSWGIRDIDPETGDFNAIWYAGLATVILGSDGAFYPLSTLSLGEAGSSWQRFFASLPTTDPDVKDELWTVDDAGLAAAVGAGARYVMMSKHA